MSDEYGTHTKWHDPKPIGNTYPPTAIAWDAGIMRFRVQKLDGVLDNVPLYQFVNGRTFEKREDAIRSAAHLAGEIPTIVTQETPCNRP